MLKSDQFFISHDFFQVDFALACAYDVAADGDVAWLENKRQIDCAIECLALCETYQIHPDSTVLTLPWPQDRFGEFQLIEIDESGHPLLEQQAILNEVPLTLGPGDLVIRVGHSFNLRFNPSNTASNSEPTSMS